MSQIIHISDEAYQSIATAAAKYGQSPEAYIETWAAHQESDPDQAWFWTPAWQQGEREADADLAAGRSSKYANDDELLEALRKRSTTRF